MGASKPASVVRTLEDALREIDRAKVDDAAVAIAKRYAAAIDADASTLGKFGPLLLDALRELGMTPKSRSSVVKGGTGDSSQSRSKWDELEARRAARLDGAATVDPAAT